MVDKNEIIEILNEKKIEFEVVEHEAVFTMKDVEKLNIAGKGIEVKNLFLRDEKGKNHFLIVAKEDTTIDMKKLKDIIGSTKLSFASEERLDKYLSLTRGCVSPFGILNNDTKDVKVFIDDKIMGDKVIGVHPNENTATLFIKTADVVDIIKEHGNDVKYIRI